MAETVTHDSSRSRPLRPSHCLPGFALSLGDDGLIFNVTCGSAAVPRQRVRDLVDLVAAPAPSLLEALHLGHLVAAEVAGVTLVERRHRPGTPRPCFLLGPSDASTVPWPGPVYPTIIPRSPSPGARHRGAPLVGDPRTSANASAARLWPPAEGASMVRPSSRDERADAREPADQEARAVRQAVGRGQAAGGRCRPRRPAARAAPGHHPRGRQARRGPPA